MINGTGDISLQIGLGIYKLTDLYSKTIYATKALNVYQSPLGKKILYTIKAGDPIGVIRGYYPKGRNGAVDNFIIVGPNTVNLAFVKYAAGNFSEYKLSQQGTKTEKEKAEKEAAEEQPWYIKLSKQVLPWAFGGAIFYTWMKSNGRNN